MSQFEATATLTGALLSNKGAAAPSRAVSALLNELPRGAQEPEPQRQPRPEPEIRLAPEVESKPAPEVESKPAFEVESKPASGKRVKLSLRLDERRHLRLKLAAAHLRQSSQEILRTALDEYLLRAVPDIRGGECACLMARDPARFGDAD